MVPTFRRADLRNPQVIALIDLHHRAAHALSPPGSAFALDLGGLADPAIALWAAWDGDALLGIGALRTLGGGEGELKSMRTDPAYLRHGVGRAMLEHLIGEAKAQGLRRLFLETGSDDAFAPARAMYEGVGFVPSGPFGDYVLTDYNRCFVLEL